MAADHIIDIISPQPGIDRDGTKFDSNMCTDGQWVRFYRGRPKSIGGQVLLDPGNNEIIRNIYNVDKKNNITDCYLGRPSTLAVCPVSNGLADPEFDRTPIGFVKDQNNNWTFELYTDLDVVSTTVNLAANPIATTTGSNVVTVSVASTAGLSTGTFVTIRGAVTTNGITADELNITTAITNVVLNTSFDYATLGVATAPGAGGGATVSYGISGPVRYIIAHAAPNVLDINNSTETLIYWGDVDTNSPLTVMTSTNQKASGGIVMLYPYFFKYGNDGVLAFTLNPGGDWSDATFASITGSKIVKGLITRSGNDGPSGLFWSLNSLIRATFVGEPAIFKFTTVQDDISILSQNCIISHDNVFYWIGDNQFYIYNGVVKELKNNTNKLFFFERLNRTYQNKVWGIYKEKFNELWWYYPADHNTECSDVIIFNLDEGCWYDTSHARSAGTTRGRYPYPLETDSHGILNKFSPVPIITNLGVNPLATVTGQNSVVVTIPANTILRTGMLVTISGATAFNGLTVEQLNPMLTPITVINNTSFRFTVSTNATGTGSGGGNLPVTYSYPNLTYGLWQEETGTDRVLYGESLAIESYFDTNMISWFEKAPTDDREMRIRRIEPDFVQSNEMSMIVKTRNFAQSNVVESKIYYFEPGQEVITLSKIDTNNMGRLVNFRFGSNIAGGSYHMGKVLLNYAPGDVRP